MVKMSPVDSHQDTETEKVNGTMAHWGTMDRGHEEQHSLVRSPAIRYMKLFHHLQASMLWH